MQSNENVIEIQARLIDGYAHLAGVVSKMLEADTVSAADRANLRVAIGVRVTGLAGAIDKAAPKRGEGDRILSTYTNPSTARPR